MEWRRECFHISKELKIEWNQINQKVLLLYIAHKGSDLLWESSVSLASANEVCLREKRFERSGNVLVQFSSVQSLSRVQLFPTSWTAACQASLSITNSNSSPWSWWCHPTISSSVIPFSSYPQSFPASGSFQMSQFFASGGQSIGVSASASVLPMNIQDWLMLDMNILSRYFIYNILYFIYILFINSLSVIF